MWGTVLALALVATADPVRLGIAIFLFSRPRPLTHLLALWLGGVALSLVTGLAVLFVLRDLALGVVHGVTRTATSSGAGQLQIVMGALALVIAALAIGFPMRQRTRMTIPCGDPLQLTKSAPTASSRLSARVQRALQEGSPWVAFSVGAVLMADLRYLAALAAILASGAATVTQIGATAAYTVVTLAFAEIPLISLLAAPAKTHALMVHLHNWIRARRRGIIALVLAAVGIVLMTSGMGNI